MEVCNAKLISVEARIWQNLGRKRSQKYAWNFLVIFYVDVKNDYECHLFIFGFVMSLLASAPAASAFTIMTAPRV